MTASAPPLVLVAGGGPAALEGALAVRRLAPEASIRLIAPDPEFRHRPFAFAEAFGHRAPEALSMKRIADAGCFEFRRDALTRIDVAGRNASLASGERTRYDALLMATGARRVEVTMGSTTFWGSDGDPALRRIMATLRRDGGDVTFAVPESVDWTLPLYELALATATWCKQHGVSSALSMVTPESKPVEALGQETSADMRRLLAEEGIGWIGGNRFGGRAAPGLVISVPRLLGRALPCLPSNPSGFLVVDAVGRVEGVPGAYAAGDVTATPIKHGGLSAQQADAAASAIVADLLGRGRPRPFDPGSVVSWWPAARVYGRHLGPFLVSHGAL